MADVQWHYQLMSPLLLRSNNWWKVFTLLLFRIDMLINSARMMLKVAPLEQFSDAEFHTVIDTNLNGCFYMTRAAIPYMKQQRNDTIVNISSHVGKAGVANIAPFCAAKCALDGLAQSLSLELRPYNVYVTTVFPGLINTDMYPLNLSDEIRRQLLSAEDVAETVLWTCTLPSSVRIDNVSIMPRQLDT